MTRALILYAPGINCDLETKIAFQTCGASVDEISVKKLEGQPAKLLFYDILVLPGGFSYGDSISSGKILSVYIKEFLKEAVFEFLKRDTLVLGICNGFQVLVKSGLLGQGITLTENANGRFEDRWIRLKVTNSKCIFTKGLDIIELPVAHREGRIITRNGNINRVLAYIDRQDQPTLEYPYNPNASEDAIAGICDDTGRIFGLMPHPERFHLPLQYSGIWGNGVPHGMKIIKNAVEWTEEHKK